MDHSMPTHPTPGSCHGFSPKSHVETFIKLIGSCKILKLYINNCDTYAMNMNTVTY